MREYLQTLSTGCIFILLLKKISLLDGHPCEIFKEDGFWHCNCKNKGLTDVPQNLAEHIEYLDLSVNRFHELNEMSFKPYEKIISLLMKKTELVNDTVEFYVFRQLKYLEILDITHSVLSKYPTFYWPPTLRVLKMSYIWAMDIVALDLPKLEELHASNNFLSAFPLINKYAPIKFINLDANSLTTITAEQLAPFCRLRYLGLDLPDDAIIRNPTRYCLCVRLQRWMKDYEVASNGFNCTPPGENMYQCDTIFSEATLAKRKECTTRKTYDLLTILLICLGFLILFAIILFTYSLIRCRQEHHKAQQAYLKRPNLIEHRPIPFNFSARDLEDGSLHSPTELPAMEPLTEAPSEVETIPQ